MAAPEALPSIIKTDWIYCTVQAAKWSFLKLNVFLKACTTVPATNL
jgi:hypothetical protein